MIKLTCDQIKDKIKEKTGLSDEEIDTRIKEKMDQLAGLVSRDGAAHIVANELKINAFEELAGGKVKIDKLMPGMRNIDILGKVIDVYEVREFSTDRGSGKVGSFLIADDTAMCRITCWHAMTDKMQGLNRSDIVRLTSGYARENNGRIEIHLNDKSDIEVNPPGETVDVPDNLSQPRPAMERKKIVDLTENDSNTEILGTIVQAFEPRFFEVCPQCGKRARPREGVFVCEVHDVVTPDYSYVMNAIIDDGSETIRATFFRDQADALIGKSREDMLNFRENKELFDDVKIDLLGQMVKLGGRVKRNDMFDRLEFTANKVTKNPDPKEEIDRMNKEMGNEQESV